MGGLFCACFEDTQRVLGQRRTRTLRALAELAGQARTAERACEVAAATLAEDPHDLPFALLYLLDSERKRATLAGLMGLDQGTPISPLTVDLDSADSPWPFGRVVESGHVLVVEELVARFGALPGGAWPDSPQRAAVLPLARPGQARLAGFVVAGISPRLLFDDEYRGFFDLMAGQIATAVVNARAYEAERRDDERSRAILESISDAFFAVDSLWRFTYLNSQAERLMGRKPGDLLGKILWDEFPGLVGSVFEQGFLRAIQEKTANSITSYYPDHDRWYEVHSYPTADGLSIYFRDVSERVRTEEQLRLIVESATDYAIFSMDLEGRVTSWNSGARNLLQYEESEILGHDRKILFIQEDIDRGIPTQELRKALEEGRAENERWHVRKDGSRFWSSGLVMPMKEGGETVGLLKIMRDTTDQKRTEQELEVSRERLDLVVNSSEVGLWYCDLPFDKLDWNAKCKEHFGLAADSDVTIDVFYERIHPDDRDSTRRAIERSIERGIEYDFEYRTVDARGKTRWIRAIGQPYFGANGTPIRFDGITLDVTGRIEQELALREADRRKNEFLATLAHELRNPLAPIRNALHLMRQPSSEGYEAERAMAERQVVHLSRLIDDLMDVARISRGKIDLRREVVELGKVVNQAVETARPQIDERRHRLIVSLPDEPIRLEGDPTRLEQILWNLLNNAAKYSEPGGRIEVTASRKGDEAIIRVIDQGFGIGPEMLPHIFDMFVQVGDHRGHAQGGLGIGLSLVRTLVEMHGGSISARSEGLGTGSEFVVRLPALVRSADSGQPVQRDRLGPTEPPPRRRILVVDDNVDAALSLARWLGRICGQEVRVAHDGHQALALASEFQPEMILLDIGLPGMDGNEVARRLRSRPEFAEALVVALTGWGQDTDVERSMAAGFDHHLVKPASPEAIAELIGQTRKGEN